MRNFFMIATAACATLSCVGIANAQTAGSGVSIDGKASIEVVQDKPVTTVGIGRDVYANTWTGSVIGDVDIKGPLDIKVHQKGAVTTVGIGQRVCASTVTGTITSVSPCK